MEKYRRGNSARIATQESRRMSGDGSSGTMTKASTGQSWAELQAMAEQSEIVLSKARSKSTPAGPESELVKARMQTRDHMPKVTRSTANGKTASNQAISRARSTANKVSKPKTAPRQTKTASVTSITRRRKASPPAPRATGLPETPVPTSNGDPLLLTCEMDGSRESSPMSDMSDAPADILIQIPSLGVRLPTPAPNEDGPEITQSRDDDMSVSDTATFTGDVEVAKTEESSAPPDAVAMSNADTPATSADDDITVDQRCSGDAGETTMAMEDTDPAIDQNEPSFGAEPTTIPLIQPEELSQATGDLQLNEDQEGESLQKRRRAVPQRYGMVSQSATGVMPPLLPFSSAAREEEDTDYEESPKKKRRVSSLNTKNPQTPAKRPQTPSKSESVAKRGSTRQKMSVTDANPALRAKPESRSAVVKLKTSPSALNKILKTPPRSTSKTPRKTPPKRPRKPASKEIPKTPIAPVLPPTPESVAAEPVRHASAVDPGKLALSRQLTAREPLGSKPKPQDQPLVWADSRQALCETLPYFKRPQGGCYQNDSHVYGFLFDSVGHCREYLDEDIIICRAGGSMEQDPSGGMVQKKDQLMKEAQVQAIFNDIAHQNPLIVICGNRNGGAQCEMPHQYSVLGWYKPVAVWEEKTTGRGKKIWTTIKYRLERLNQAGEPAPWYAPAGSEIASLRSSDQLTYRQECTECGKVFDQVYLQGWMCLNSACDDFWKLGGLSAPSGNTGLDYNPDFLLSRSPAWGDESIAPAPVRPPIPDVGNIIGDNLAYINTRGICCPRCGRCNSRRLFDRWICENPSCDYELRPQHRPVMPTHLHTPWDVAPTLVRNKVEAGVHLKIEYRFGYKVCTYTFDGIDGCFIHAAATMAILSAPNGPDEIMASLQSEDLGLERRVFAVTKTSGGKKLEDRKPAEEPQLALPSPPDDQQPAPMAHKDEEPPADKRKFDEGDLMTAFSINYGMPYKFVASGASTSFESSPKAVSDCRYRLNWAARTLLGKSKDALDFNEELILTYLEGQKIEYHDDGEDGLGPEIASLSLGGRAKMHMRMKAKHFVGCSKTGILTEEKPMPASIDGPTTYQKRLAAWEELQKLKPDSVAYNKRRKELPKELGIFDKRMKKADDLVTVTLSHGDIMVMDGYDIQRYLEHKVVPEGYLRFALTCRTVLEGHLKPEERPDYVVQADEGKYDGSAGY